MVAGVVLSLQSIDANHKRDGKGPFVQDAVTAAGRSSVCVCVDC